MTFRDLLRSPYLILDTETTGVGRVAEIVQIAILDDRGEMLLDTLVRPTQSVPEAASRIHGLTDAHLCDAPLWTTVHPRVDALLAGRDVIIYNAPYDTRLLRQSNLLAGLAPDLDARFHCAMRGYKEWRGRGPRGYFTGLVDACRLEGIPVMDVHNAGSDCRLTLALCHKMKSYL